MDVIKRRIQTITYSVVASLLISQASVLGMGKQLLKTGLKVGKNFVHKGAFNSGLTFAMQPNGTMSPVNQPMKTKDFNGIPVQEQVQSGQQFKPKMNPQMQASHMQPTFYISPEIHESVTAFQPKVKSHKCGDLGGTIDASNQNLTLVDSDHLKLLENRLRKVKIEQAKKETVRSITGIGGGSDFLAKKFGQDKRLLEKKNSELQSDLRNATSKLQQETKEKELAQKDKVRLERQLEQAQQKGQLVHTLQKRNKKLGERVKSAKEENFEQARQDAETICDQQTIISEKDQVLKQERQRIEQLEKQIDQINRKKTNMVEAGVQARPEIEIKTGLQSELREAKTHIRQVIQERELLKTENRQLRNSKSKKNEDINELKKRAAELEQEGKQAIKKKTDELKQEFNEKLRQEKDKQFVRQQTADKRTMELAQKKNGVELQVKDMLGQMNKKDQAIDLQNQNIDRINQLVKQKGRELLQKRDELADFNKANSALEQEKTKLQQRNRQIVDQNRKELERYAFVDRKKDDASSPTATPYRPARGRDSLQAISLQPKEKNFGPVSDGRNIKTKSVEPKKNNKTKRKKISESQKDTKLEPSKETVQLENVGKRGKAFRSGQGINQIPCGKFVGVDSSDDSLPSGDEDSEKNAEQPDTKNLVLPFGDLSLSDKEQVSEYPVESHSTVVVDRGKKCKDPDIPDSKKTGFKKLVNVQKA